MAFWLRKSIGTVRNKIVNRNVHTDSGFSFPHPVRKQQFCFLHKAKHEVRSMTLAPLKDTASQGSPTYVQSYASCLCEKLSRPMDENEAMITKMF